MEHTLQDAFRRFAGGDSNHAYTLLGCHAAQENGLSGYRFRVWAPNALKIRIVGDGGDTPMCPLACGVWEAFSQTYAEGDAYAFEITRPDGTTVRKNDPYAFRFRTEPQLVAVIDTPREYEWGDEDYRFRQTKKRHLDNPMNIYELHVGSWRRRADGDFCNYEELARELIPYLLDMGYTHVELLPLAEHPAGPSRNRQVTGFYAPTARYGTPQQLMKFVDLCHQAGIGVLLDWVCAGFSKDESGLIEFDGTCCYEASDARTNEQTEGATRRFDYSRGEVQSFLISAAVYWIEVYHFDGLRVGAVDAVIYPSRSRADHARNRFGGIEDPEGIAFLRKLNRAIFSVRRTAVTCAEESMDFPLVTKPDYDGGLGFSYKWNTSWTNSTLKYMSLDPLQRKESHARLTFTTDDSPPENYILPLSHDEVTHGKGALLGKMSGTYDRKFANLRACYAYMIAHPGKKLTFMGNEFAQLDEWSGDREPDRSLTEVERHRQMRDYVRELNHFYLEHGGLWGVDSKAGFHRLSSEDESQSVIVFLRNDRRGRALLVLCNFSTDIRTGYRIGLLRKGVYEPLLSSDEARFGGSGTPLPFVRADKIPMHGLQYSGEFTLPPLSVTFYKHKTGQPNLPANDCDEQN